MATSEKANIGTNNDLRDSYFRSLQTWLKSATISQNASVMFPLYLWQNYPQVFRDQQIHQRTIQSRLSPTTSVDPAAAVHQTDNNNNRHRNANDGRRIWQFRIMDDISQEELIIQSGGYEVVIAPFWKRAIAEFIDIMILLLVKIIATFIMMNIFDFDLELDFDKEVIQKAIGDDDIANILTISFDLLSFSSDLLILEITTKVAACVCEAILTRKYGATIGKAFMHLRIENAEAVLPLDGAQPRFRLPRTPIRALLYPSGRPSFERCLMRATSKTLIMSLLFPMCFVMFFFRNNRTAYDIITNTIVIEDNPNPVHRRPVRN